LKPSKPLLVILPGLDGTGLLLERFVDRLSADFEVTVISYPMDPKLGYAELAELVREQLPSKPFILLGESFSGPIAIELAAREKERTQGLVLAVSFAKSPLPSFLAPLANMFNSRLAPKWLSQAMLLSGFDDNALSRKLQSVLASLPDAVVRKRLSEVATVDKTDLLRQIECPILYLRGSQDRLVGKGSADLICQSIKNSHIEVLDAPHMLLSTHADEVAETMRTVNAGVKTHHWPE